MFFVMVFVISVVIMLFTICVINIVKVLAMILILFHNFIHQ